MGLDANLDDAFLALCRRIPGNLHHRLDDWTRLNPTPSLTIIIKLTGMVAGNSQKLPWIIIYNCFTENNNKNNNGTPAMSVCTETKTDASSNEPTASNCFIWLVCPQKKLHNMKYVNFQNKRLFKLLRLGIKSSKFFKNGAGVVMF